MTKTQMLHLLHTRQLSIIGLKLMCKILKIDASGLKPEPIKRRLLQYLADEEIETNTVSTGITLLGTMGS